MPTEVTFLTLAPQEPVAGWRESYNWFAVDNNGNRDERDVYADSGLLGPLVSLCATLDGAPAIGRDGTEFIYLSLNWAIREYGTEEEKAQFRTVREKVLKEFDELVAGQTA